MTIIPLIDDNCRDEEDLKNEKLGKQFQINFELSTQLFILT